MRIRSSSRTDCASKTSDSTSSESRVKKKRKRLDAILTNDAFTRKRSPSGVGNDDDDDLPPRRSGRLRRAPIILDASPTPVRKRLRRNGASVLAGKTEEVQIESNLSRGDKIVGWKARLRSTAVSMDIGRENSNGKRKLCENSEEEEEDLQIQAHYSDNSEDQVDENANGKTSIPIKMASSSGIEYAAAVKGTDNGAESCSCRKDENDNKNVESVNVVDSLHNDSSDCNFANGAHIVVNLDIHCSDNEYREKDKLNNMQFETIKEPKSDGYCAHENETCGGVTVDKPERKKSIVEEEAAFDKNDEKAKDEHVPEMANLKAYFHRKEGRRCGLCGVGTDGRPPKPLVQDSADSENEVCSEFSASDETNYDIWDGFGDEPGWLGRLLGPINDRYGITSTWVHQHCAVWSPEVYFAGLGRLKNVRTALCRGRSLKCVRCGRRGATIGCRVDRCPKAYHLPCARATGCIFDHRKFLVACAEHRYIFQAQGSQYLRQIRKMKAKKLKLELRKTSVEASRKDFEAEEKWMEKCGEDEEFVKREKKRLHRDLQRLAPVYIGGGATSDKENLFQGWESVAGLEDVVQCMKEVVILPLLYPEFFTNIGLTPPRGVLLHGYPGTGKTLVVRALIGSCARGSKRIAYFARKGADCLGKYVGDAERQLRLLFQVAERSQPSIIFFDEIDGLAPCRTRKQDQTQSSVVSTLLALMDGLNSRGSVIVIGATNRPDSVDPALRRPGRFDREIYFPLPSTKDRSAILSLQTRNWPKPVAGPLLKLISSKTVGFAGADLQALCTQAAMIALKRNCPLQELLSAAGKGSHSSSRVPLPSFLVEERDWLEALSCAPPPCSRREAGMAANDVMYSPLSAHLIPCLLQPLCSLLVSLYFDEHLCLPAPISRAAKMIESTLIQSLDREKLPRECWWLEVDKLLQDGNVVQQLVKKLSSISEICANTEFQTGGSADIDGFDDWKPQINRPFTVTRGSYEIAGNKTGFRIMISGIPRSGQHHLASCLLNSYVGNIEIHKLDLATMTQEGHGDLLQGLTQILKKCSSANSCVLFMPRVELWASEKCDPEHEKSSIIDEQPSENTTVYASHLWNSFVEQVDTICISTRLMILSTSEVPYVNLPPRTKQFFDSGEMKWQNLTPSINILPRFVVQIGGKFNHHVLIGSAAAKLTRDVIQLFLEFSYKRIHSQPIQCEGNESCHSLESDTGTITGSILNQADNQMGNTQAPERPIDFPNPVVRNMKGRSNMLLAISTFGYQILWYPHFAELNWVTSKLKDGPCSDINGPWKAWPFNSCIVRPSDSSDNSVVACSPNAASKRKDNYSLVRGLTAVGLSAYRGLYSSVQEVWEDVRRVLELLMKVISEKIDSGKDKYIFIRLSSQVAYLEDIVTNWVHTFKGLELGSQVTHETQDLAFTVRKEGLGAQVDGKIACDAAGEAVAPAVSPIIANHANQNHEDVSAPESLVCLDNSDLSDPAVRCHDPITISDKDLRNEDMVKQAMPYGSVGPLIYSNEFSKGVSAELSNNLTKPANTNDADTRSGDQCEYYRNKQTVPTNKTKADGKERQVCLYNCCAKCMSILYGSMQKLMMHKWEESSGDWSVEDVDDVVRSLSANLVLAFKSKYNTENSKIRLEQVTNLNQCDSAKCKSLVLQECVRCINDANASSQTECFQAELRSKFVYQDGVPLTTDFNKDICYHCNFSTLCLCALIEWVSVFTGGI